jgi:hypothetical protein
MLSRFVEGGRLVGANQMAGSRAKRHCGLLAARVLDALSLGAIAVLACRAVRPFAL